jgi:hypothetical protein
VPRADAAYVVGPPDRIDTSLDVDGTLTVDGNVGVGTTAPSARLHVRNGSLHVGMYTNFNNEGFLSLAGPGAALQLVRRSLNQWTAPVPGDGYQLYVNSADSTLRLWTTGQVPDLLTVTKEGKLGLGTNDPQARLDVAGDVRVSGGLQFAGNLGVGTATPESRLQVRGGSVHVGFDTGEDREGFLSLAGPGAILQLVGRDVTGWPAPSGGAFQLYVAGGALRVSSRGNVGDSLMLTSDGKLGLGTSNPAARLDVVGDVKVSGGLQFTGNLLAGSLGVGVATPEARLHVRGGAAHLGFYTSYTREGHLSLAGPGASLGLTRTDLTAWPAAPAAGDQYWLYNNAGAVRLWTWGAGDLLSVTADGKVGLGVLAPSARLDVGGDARFGGVAQFVGNVGVGTAAPSARLHVRGGAVHLGFYTSYTKEGHLSLAGPGAAVGLTRTDLTAWPAAPAAGDQFWIYNGGGSIRFWTWGAGDLLAFTSAGNLGLGTLSPTARLDVVGTARVAGPLTVSGPITASGPITVNGVTAIDTAGAALKTYYAP